MRELEDWGLGQNEGGNRTGREKERGKGGWGGVSGAMSLGQAKRWRHGQGQLFSKNDFQEKPKMIGPMQHALQIRTQEGALMPF